MLNGRRTWMWDHGDRVWWFVGLLAVIALWAVVVWLIVGAVRRPGGGAPVESGPAAPASPARPTPEQILAERLARGEIDPDDYRLRLETLRALPPDTAPPS
ncbi:MAG: hypothetical protein ACKOA2_05100 [Ilumatobacteraceae bacterium]